MEKVVSRMGIREICIGYGHRGPRRYMAAGFVDDPIEVRVGTVGRPIPGLETQGDRASGRELKPNQAGEICVRGHCVMAGYYDDAEATSRAIDEDGSGDLACRQNNRNFGIRGPRDKEMIIRGGENSIRRRSKSSSIIIRPSPRRWYWPARREVWRSRGGLGRGAGSTITADDLMSYCLGQIAYFKIPRLRQPLRRHTPLRR